MGSCHGAARFLGENLIGVSDEPLRVVRSPLEWFYHDGRAVLPLQWASYPLLKRHSRLAAMNADHADALIERVFVKPAYGLPNAQVENALYEGTERVGLLQTPEEREQTIMDGAIERLLGGAE